MRSHHNSLLCILLSRVPRELIQTREPYLRIRLAINRLVEVQIAIKKRERESQPRKGMRCSTTGGRCSSFLLDPKNSFLMMNANKINNASDTGDVMLSIGYRASDTKSTSKIHIDVLFFLFFFDQTDDQRRCDSWPSSFKRYKTKIKKKKNKNLSLVCNLTTIFLRPNA